MIVTRSIQLRSVRSPRQLASGHWPSRREHFRRQTLVASGGTITLRTTMVNGTSRKIERRAFLRIKETRGEGVVPQNVSHVHEILENVIRNVG
jgi:hypothetical protein